MKSKPTASGYRQKKSPYNDPPDNPAADYTLSFTVAVLCSPAADNVRGQAWAVDGGWTAQ